MQVEIVTFGADPNRGGFGNRVHNLARIFAQFAEVRVVLTDWFQAPTIDGVTYSHEPLRDGPFHRLRRLRHYYRGDFPRRNVTSPPDFVVVESLDLLGMYQYGSGVPLVLDEHNVYWDLLRFEIIDSPFFRTWVGRREFVRNRLVPRLLDRAKSYEIAAIRSASQTLVTSERDRGLLLAELPELRDRIHVLPNCVDLAQHPQRPDDTDASGVVFVGNFAYLPNREAATFVTEELAPAMPETTFLLVGAHPPTAAWQVKNVIFAGHREDIQTVLRTAAICIAPLAKGGGTRIKILTYLAAGKAVVATTKACEGLEVQDGVHLLIRDGGEGFISGVRELLGNPSRRTQIGRAGRRLVEQKYDWRTYVSQLAKLASQIAKQ